jgi:mono/diheme cytochrome c family protein
MVLPTLALVTLLSAACGTVATPEWAADAQETRAALAVTADYMTAMAPTATPTSEPTATPVPPTETPVPTATPTEEPPTATPEPTETPLPPTEEATAEVAASGDSSEDAIAAALEAGDPEAGQVVFNAPHETAVGVWMCGQCHSITPDELRLIGPGLWNVAERAETRVEGENAVEYIRNSILHPNDYIVPGEPSYPEGLMPQNYADVLSEQELNDVIAYLLTLHD